MATKIRLTRMGNKKAPEYRIIVTDSRNARDSEYIDQIGYYNPMKSHESVVLDQEKANNWLSKGAQPSDRVRVLFKGQGLTAKSLEKKQVKKIEKPAKKSAKKA